MGTRHHPLLGSWSSASLSLGTDVNNPGPMHADLVAPFAHLFDPGVGQVLGVTTVNVACLVGALLAARRTGGWRFERLVLVAAAALAWTMGSELLFDMFQAHALLFPFLFVLVLLVAALAGHPWAWPWLAVGVSLLVQTHISYAYIVAFLLVTVAASVLVRTAPPRLHAVVRASRSRIAAWSFGVLALLWFQPVIEQLFGEGQGNLSRLARNAAGTDVTVGLRNSIKLVAAVFTLPPWWTRFGFADTIQPAGAVETADGVQVQIPGLPDGFVALGALVVIASLLWWCRRRAVAVGDRVSAAAHLVALAGLGGAVVALSRLTVGPTGLAPHHTRWVFVLALFAHVAIARSLLAWLLPRLPSPAARHAPTGIVAVLVLGFTAWNVPAYAQQHGPTDDADTMDAMRRLFPALDALRDHGPVLYRTDNLRVFEPYSSAVQLQLRARDIEFRLDQEIPLRHLGESRRADGTEVAVLAQYEKWAALAGAPRGCVLATASALDAGDDAAMRAGAAALADRVVAAGFEVDGVLIEPEAREIDRRLASRIRAGDVDALREITYDGRLRAWVERSWASGPADVVDELLDEGPAITAWLDTVVALVVSPADVCDG